MGAGCPACVNTAQVQGRSCCSPQDPRCLGLACAKLWAVERQGCIGEALHGVAAHGGGCRGS